jgi:hypothetical protein
MQSFLQFLLESKKKSRQDHFCWNEGDYTIHSLKEDTQTFHSKISMPSEDAINETERRLHKDAADHTKSFSANHLHHIKNYKELSLPINDYHRLSKKRSERLDDDTKHLDHVTSHKTSHDFHAYRAFGGHDVSHLEQGDIIHDKGYTGTSLQTSVPHSIARHEASIRSSVHKTHGVVAYIHIPKGTKGYYLDHHSGTYSHEKEFLLHRGTHFKVTGHSHDPETNIHYVHMTVHKQDEH